MARGEITHIEIPADDLDRAKRFYSAVAGWDFSEMEGMPNYWLFRTSESSGGGIGRRGESVGEVVTNYVTVDSIDSALEAVRTNGGSIVTDKSEIPGMGTWAHVRDSEGNDIGLWEDAAAS